MLTIPYKTKTKVDTEKIYGQNPGATGFIPEYVYDYGDFKITCNVCDGDFDYKELTSATIYDYQGNEAGYAERVCPHCRNQECCEEIQYAL